MAFPENILVPECQISFQDWQTQTCHTANHLSKLVLCDEEIDHYVKRLYNGPIKIYIFLSENDLRLSRAKNSLVIYTAQASRIRNVYGRLIKRNKNYKLTEVPMIAEIFIV